jgi:hypothetical protein
MQVACPTDFIQIFLPGTLSQYEQLILEQRRLSLVQIKPIKPKGQELGAVSRGWIVVVLWSVLATAGMFAVARSGRAVSRPETPVDHWPDASPVPRNPGRATVLVAIHPRCPCTPATLIAVHELIRREPGRFDVVCLATHPIDAGDAWVHASNVEMAREIPGAVVVMDPEGDLAAAHGLRASGQVILYAADGKVVFDGGLTPGRGMVASGEVVARLLDPTRSSLDRADAFGCPLVGAEGRRP